jgi:hypothetical protein
MMLAANQRRLFAHSVVSGSKIRLPANGLLIECDELSPTLCKRRSSTAKVFSAPRDGQRCRDYASSDVHLLPILHRRITPVRDNTRVDHSTVTVRYSSTAGSSEGSPVHHESSVSLHSDSKNNGKETWLVVGDGDLSYSAWAARNLHDNISLFASVLEDEATHEQVYRNSASHADSIHASGHSVLFEVDATQLPSRFPASFFDRIIFNFPHWRGKANNRYNRLLVNDFLQSAAQVLNPTTGEIHVALVPRQGGTNARNSTEWRQSWLVAQYAAEHGLLLRNIRDFNVEYDLSSHRGVDRPFSIGDAPCQYILAYPNGDPVDLKLQVACRHELRIRLNESAIAGCGFTREELVHGDAILQLAEQLVAGTGIRASVPMRAVVTPEEEEEDDSLLLVSLLVYSGESQPLSRARADEIRASLERAVMEQLGLHVTKKNHMVSRPFPAPMLDALIEERTKSLES